MADERGTGQPDPRSPTADHQSPPAAAHSRPRKRYRAWALLLPVIGLLAGALFSASKDTARGTDLRSSALELPSLIRDHNIVGQQRVREVARLNSEVEALSRAAAPSNERLSALQNEAEALTGPSGTLAVHGPSIAVTLDDSKLPREKLPANMPLDSLIVHQQDLQGVVNALWRGGAEAMMLMDQRVISTSAVRCVGNTLILQGRVYSPPYTIRAIGDLDRLQAALDREPAVQIYRDYVDAVGLGYEVTTQRDAVFPAYSGAVGLQYAKVA